ncbi:MAG: hypothetical protein ACRDTD_18855 [Pseudonocardiaceae bacterium]
MTTPKHVTGSIEIAKRFRGPHRSGNGGYTAGLLAARLLGDHAYAGGEAATVTLRQPPPLDTPLDLVTVREGRLRLLGEDGSVIAQVEGASPLPEPPRAVELTEAGAASLQFRGRVDHPFPFCFSCGTDRPEHEALRLTPGPLPHRQDTVATVWRPGEDFSAAAIPDGATAPDDKRVAVPAVWAALDCPGAWAANFDYGRPIVLGRITAAAYREIKVSGEYAVVGHCRSLEGRKALTATAIYDEHGSLLAAAEAIWLQVDPKTFAGLLA